METQQTQRAVRGRDKTTALGVRKARGGFIVTYRMPPPAAQTQQHAMSLAAALTGEGHYEQHEVVCTDLTEVNGLLVELLGDDA